MSSRKLLKVNGTLKSHPTAWGLTSKFFQYKELPPKKYYLNSTCEKEIEDNNENIYLWSSHGPLASVRVNFDSYFILKRSEVLE